MRLCGVDVVQTETGTWEKCSERKKTGKLAPPDINGLKPNLVCDHLRPKPSWSTKSADRGGGELLAWHPVFRQEITWLSCSHHSRSHTGRPSTKQVLYQVWRLSHKREQKNFGVNGLTLDTRTSDIKCYGTNLVPRAFPIEIGRGGKRPWHRLVTWFQTPENSGCNKLRCDERVK